MATQVEVQVLDVGRCLLRDLAADVDMVAVAAVDIQSAKGDSQSVLQA